MLARILSQELINNRYHLIRMDAPPIARAYRPGQFVMIGLGGAEMMGEAGSFDPLLRRPFSLYDCSAEMGWVDVLYKVQGRGTAIMAGWGVNRLVEMTGPFGRGFLLDDPRSPVILVGGGVGIPPLLTVADELARRSKPPRMILLLGGRSAPDIFHRDIPGLEVRIATEDGTLGEKGRVTVLLEQALSQRGEGENPVVLSCGPNPMMKAVSELCARAGVPCQVSLENRMGCALGVCLGCVVPSVEGHSKRYPRVCTEGPVFDSAILDWNSPNWPAMG